MSYPVSRTELLSSRGLTASATSAAPELDPPTSAPVLEYICLFTHDLRRKQKRWQDGKLKYHTFNRRVMVYDDRGHFIGDGHWQEDYNLQSGEQLDLDRGGAIVEVSDFVNSTEQDLTELLSKRAAQVEKRREASGPAMKKTTRTQHSSVPNEANAVPSPRHAYMSAQKRPSNPHMLHRPLTSMLQSPGPTGRAAVADKSPFEARIGVQPRRELEKGVVNYANKRRRLNNEEDDLTPSKPMGHAQALFGTKLTLTAVPMSTPPVRSQPLRDLTNTINQQELSPNLGEKQDRHEQKEKPEENLVPMMDSSSGTQEVQHIGTKGVVLGSKIAKEARGARNAPVEVPATQDELPLAHAVASPQPPNASRSVSRDRRPLSERQEASAGHSPQHPSSLQRKELLAPRANPVLCSRRRSGSPPERHSSVVSHTSDAGEVDCNGRVQQGETPSECAEEGVQRQDKEKDKKVVDGVFTTTRPHLPNRRRDEPRTELRIRARKKRGLLMMSDKLPPIPPWHAASDRVLTPEGVDGPSGEEKPASSEKEHSPSLSHCAPVLDDKEPKMEQSLGPQHDDIDFDAEATREPRASRKKARRPTTEHTNRTDANHHCKSPSQSSDTSTFEDAPSNVARIHRTRKARGDKFTGSVGSSEDNEPAGMKVRERRVDPDVQAPFEEGPEKVGINVTKKEPSRFQVRKMGSRSVKSREIFGFIPPADNTPVPAGFHSANRERNDPIDPPNRVLPTEVPSHLPNAGADSAGRASGSAEKPDSLPKLQEDQALDEDGAGAKAEALRHGLRRERSLPTTLSHDGLQVERPAPAQGKHRSLQRSKTVATGVDDCASLGGPLGTGAGQITTTGKASASASTGSGIRNPATRGRKAALQEHAKCPPLQTTIPMDPTRSVAAESHAAKSSSKPAGNFPGFRRANGGAWSAEAFDLLGMSRPGT